MSFRAATRDSARLVVVGNYSASGYKVGTTSCPTSASDQTQQIACRTNSLVDAIAGTAYTKVLLPSTWAVGGTVTICTMVKNEGLTGMVPTPAGGYTKSLTKMYIENTTAPTSSTTTYPSTLPASLWTWCA